jgi:hypothetical protein
MSIDLVSQMSFGDAMALRDWMFVHRLEHNRFAQVLANRGVAPVPGGVDSPSATEAWIRMMQDPESPIERSVIDWLQTHNTLHQSEFDALGFGQAPDIEDVDFRDASQFYDWMFAHTLIHDQVAASLGL